MGRARMFIWLIISIFVLFGVFMFWYRLTYSMGVCPAYSVNTPESSYSCLILSQGSDFKEALVDRVVENLKEEDVFIRVMDVTQMDAVNIRQWDATLIVHTWEYWLPPKPVRELFEKNVPLNSVLFYTTSGAGDGQVKGVDAITSASNLELVDQQADIATKRLSEILFVN